MAEILKNQTENLRPCLGTLLNKRKKDRAFPIKQVIKNYLKKIA